MRCKKATIGIPLFNEEKYIEDALRSAASQCENVWVSDNASTDGSVVICEMLGREYPNVHFVRQPQNIGTIANFKFLLDKADTPFFMWLGGHDALPDGYVSKLLRLLEDCPDAVLAYGASHHVDIYGNPARNYDYYFHEMLSNKIPATRVMGLIQHLNDCSLVHGIFRTEVLREAWNTLGAKAFIGGDHVLLGHVAIEGPFLYAPETYLIRRNAHPSDTQQDQLKRMDMRQPDSEQLNFKELQRRQYLLAAKISSGTGLPGFVFRLRARFALVKRFGPFGEAFMTRMMDALFFLMASPLSDVPHQVLKASRNACRSMVCKLNGLLRKWRERLHMAIAIHRLRNNLKVILGSSGTKQEGWISTDYPLLDLTDIRTFSRLFNPGSVSNFIAEHVWEHLSLEDGAQACRNCFLYQKQGGILRIAVPDGFHIDAAYIDQVKPGGYGPGAEDHKVIYNYRTLSALLENAGYKIKLLEWFDEQGNFHHENWDIGEGHIKRSTRFDKRNRDNPTAYTSLIIDARKQ